MVVGGGSKSPPLGCGSKSHRPGIVGTVIGGRKSPSQFSILLDIIGYLTLEVVSHHQFLHRWISDRRYRNVFYQMLILVIIKSEQSFISGFKSLAGHHHFLHH